MTGRNLGNQLFDNELFDFVRAGENMLQVKVLLPDVANRFIRLTLLYREQEYPQHDD